MSLRTQGKEALCNIQGDLVLVCDVRVCVGGKKGSYSTSSHPSQFTVHLRFHMLLPSSDGTDARQLGPDWELQKV